MVEELFKGRDGHVRGCKLRMIILEFSVFHCHRGEVGPNKLRGEV